LSSILPVWRPPQHQYGSVAWYCAHAMIRLLVLDVEGVITLPGGSQYPWPLEEMLSVRRALAEAPFGCILCTGRQVPYGEAVIQALDLFRPLPQDAAACARRAGFEIGRAHV